MAASDTLTSLVDELNLNTERKSELLEKLSSLGAETSKDVADFLTETDVIPPLRLIEARRFIQKGRTMSAGKFMII